MADNLEEVVVVVAAVIEEAEAGVGVEVGVEEFTPEEVVVVVMEVAEGRDKGEVGVILRATEAVREEALLEREGEDVYNRESSHSHPMLLWSLDYPRKSKIAL